MKTRKGSHNYTICISLVVWAVLSVSGTGMVDAQNAPAVKNERLQKNVYVIGHRGAAGLTPENTLAGFRQALELGVDAVEMDVQLSADGTLVIYHDFTLKPEITRLPNGNRLDMWKGLPVKDLTVAELKQYDVGRLDPYTTYARRYPDQIPKDGEGIPTLEEVIRLLESQQDEKTQLWIEIKTSPKNVNVSSAPEEVAKKVVDLLRREEFIHRSRVLSFDWRSLVYIRKTAPDIDTVFVSTTSLRNDMIEKGKPGMSPWTAGVDVDDYGGSIPRMIKALGGQYWAPRYNQLSSGQLKEAHQLNMKVFVWTVDSERDLRRFIKMGVDGIFTNRPDILLTVLSGG